MQKPPQRSIAELLSAYRSYLLSKVSKVRILGEADERELEDVFVELSIVEQRTMPQQAGFLGMIDSAMRGRFNPFADNDGGTSERCEKETKRHVQPDELLRLRTKAIVTGTPGCGKTTLFKYLALQAHWKEKRLAVWLELKAVVKPLFAQAEEAAAKDGSLILQELWLIHVKAQLSLSDAEIQLLRQHWRDKFKASEIAVLLDGFDELQDAEIECSLNRCIREFASAAHDNTLLISTRPYAQHKLGNERLQELKIESLNQRQIEAFLNRYYPNDAAAKSLLKALRERSSLRELLHVPLLLGVILCLYRENRFADERLELYETIILDLVHELDRSKSIVRQFRINDKRLRLHFLKFLAFERLLRDPFDAEEQEVNRIVFSYDLLKEKARAFLAQERLPHHPRDLTDDALATPLLREVGTGTFAFTHLTFQEYLAARAFVALYEGNKREGLKVFCRAYHNPTIAEMEVLPMALGVMTNANRLYSEIEGWPESLTFTGLRLRARGLTYSAKIDPRRLACLIDRLVEFILEKEKRDEEPYREIIVNSFVGVNHQTVSLIESAVLAETGADRLVWYAHRLGRIGSESAVALLTSALMDDRGGYGHWVESLKQIGSEKAVEALVSVLNDKGHDARWSAADALGDIGSEKAVSALVSVLNDKKNDVRWSAAEALLRIGSEEPLNMLISALNGKSKRARRDAVEAFGRVSPESAVDALISALKDEDSEVRWRAAYALAWLGSEKAVGALVSILSDEDHEVRWRGAYALGKIRSEKAVSALISVLVDEGNHARWAAADALGEIGSEKAIDALSSALNDKEGGVRSKAACALGRIGSEKAIDVLVSALNSENKHTRFYAAYALGWSGPERGRSIPERAVEVLTSALNDEEYLKDNDGSWGIDRYFAREHAAYALGRIGSERAVDALIPNLNNKHLGVCQAAAIALGRLGSEKAVGAFISVMNGHGWAHEQAAKALARMGVETLTKGLALALKHPDAFAREKAALAISYYSGDRPTLDQLNRLARTEKNNKVSAAASEAAEKFARKLELLGHPPAQGPARPLKDNESREGVLVGEITKITFGAGHIFRPTPNSDWGIDGEIEFKDEHGEASGQRVYLQLKSGDSYLRTRKADGKEIFTIKNPRHAKYWPSHAYPVLLMIRNSTGQIRWMNVSEYLRRHGVSTRQIEFQGEPFTAESVKQMRARFAR
jgi:HEAT repeat protein